MTLSDTELFGKNKGLLWAENINERVELTQKEVIFDSSIDKNFLNLGEMFGVRESGINPVDLCLRSQQVII